MDEFKNHAEKEFWERIYVASLTGGNVDSEARDSADCAVVARRTRMAGLVKPPGVKAA